MREQHLIVRAKAMRRDMTDPERKLWYELRAKRYGGAKFRRQQVIGPYIADFACRRPMLVIEVDGETHAGREGYDSARTAYLENQGYRVIRIANRDVMRDLEGVLTMIATFLETPPLPDPLP